MSEIQPRQLECFDYEGVARDVGLSEEDLAAIERGTRPDYLHDDMLFELRMLRTLRAIQGGHVTVAKVLKELAEDAAAA